MSLCGSDDLLSIGLRAKSKEMKVSHLILLKAKNRVYSVFVLSAGV
jgi:hypothetical protein